MITRGWPCILYGGTGVTNSVTAMSLGAAIADEHTKTWLEREVITAPVMYADWELNADIQGRRAYHMFGRTSGPLGPTMGGGRRPARSHRQFPLAP